MCLLIMHSKAVERKWYFQDEGVSLTATPGSSMDGASRTGQQVMMIVMMIDRWETEFFCIIFSFIFVYVCICVSISFHFLWEMRDRNIYLFIFMYICSMYLCLSVFVFLSLSILIILVVCLSSLGRLGGGRSDTLSQLMARLDMRHN